VIDEATNTVTATIPVGAGPWLVAVDPAARNVYVANVDDDTVSVIDEATNTVTATSRTLLRWGTRTPSTASSCSRWPWIPLPVSSTWPTRLTTPCR
jgi:YVTN family beta-propeller protein